MKRLRIPSDLARRESWSITSASVSCDGRRSVASGCRRRNVPGTSDVLLLWDSERNPFTGQCLETWSGVSDHGHDGLLRGELTHDAAGLALAGLHDAAVSWWDVETKQCKIRYVFPWNSVAMASTRDSGNIRFAVFGCDRRVRLLDPREGGTLVAPRWECPRDSELSGAISGDGRWITVTGRDQKGTRECVLFDERATSPVGLTLAKEDEFSSLSAMFQSPERRDGADILLVGTRKYEDSRWDTFVTSWRTRGGPPTEEVLLRGTEMERLQCADLALDGSILAFTTGVFPGDRILHLYEPVGDYAWIPIGKSKATYSTVAMSARGSVCLVKKEPQVLGIIELDVDSLG